MLEQKLEDQRSFLIRLIDSKGLRGSANNKVTVVFDGRADVFGFEQFGSVDVIFTSGETADDKIKKIVEQAENSKNIIVVSDDRAVQYAIRSLGAKVLTVKSFLKGKKRTTSGQSSSEAKKKIGFNTEQMITHEMEDIWLKKKEKTEKNDHDF